MAKHSERTQGTLYTGFRQIHDYLNIILTSTLLSFETSNLRFMHRAANCEIITCVLEIMHLHVTPSQYVFARNCCKRL